MECYSFSNIYEYFSNKFGLRRYNVYIYIFLIYIFLSSFGSERWVELTFPIAFHTSLGKKGSQFYGGVQE